MNLNWCLIFDVNLVCYIFDLKVYFGQVEFYVDVET